MVANVRGFTPNFKFKLINFDTPRWHTLEYDNWKQLDYTLGLAGIQQNSGVWLNGVPYIVGERVIDADLGELYRCLVAHTSAATGTFAEDRAANPSYWVLQLAGVPVFRGPWTDATNYASGDIVTLNTYDYFLCTASHVSSVAFDPTKFVTIFLASNVVLAAETARDDAQGFANAAGTSATNAATSETNAASSESNAANSAIEAANQATAMRGTSTTSSLIIAPPTNIAFETQAGKHFAAGQFVTIVSNAQPTNRMYGTVSSYSGTTLNVDIEQSHGIGNGPFDAWNIYVSGAVGPQGIIEEAPIDGQQYARQGSTWQLLAAPPSLYVSDTPPPGAADNSLWWESDLGILYVRYNDGNSTQWVQAVSMPAVDTSAFIPVSGGTMTGPLTLSGDPTNALHAVPKQYVDAAARSVAQCYLKYINTTTVRIERCDGNLIAINGTLVPIPSAGVDVTTAGAIASSVYFIYCFNDSGTLGVEKSLTVAIKNATTGIWEKTGDSTRMLLGMAWTNASILFSNIATASYFNRRNKSATHALAASAATANAPWVTLVSTGIIDYVTWEDESVQGTVNASCTHTASAQPIYVGLQASSLFAGTTFVRSNGANEVTMSSAGVYTGQTRGKHQAIIVGGTSGGTATYQSFYTHCSITTRG